MTKEEEILAKINFKNECYEKDLETIKKTIAKFACCHFFEDMIRVGYNHALSYKRDEVAKYIKEEYPEYFV